MELLKRRLARVAQLYVERFGIDVRDLPGSGAAGGLGGGLAALGATLVPGFELVADRFELAESAERELPSSSPARVTSTPRASRAKP